MAKCFQCGGEHTGTYSCMPPEAPALTKTVSTCAHILYMDAKCPWCEIERLRNIITGCPVCSELERNIRPASEPER